MEGTIRKIDLAMGIVTTLFTNSTFSSGDKFAMTRDATTFYMIMSNLIGIAKVDIVANTTTVIVGSASPTAFRGISMNVDETALIISDVNLGLWNLALATNQMRIITPTGTPPLYNGYCILQQYCYANVCGAIVSSFAHRMIWFMRFELNFTTETLATSSTESNTRSASATRSGSFSASPTDSLALSKTSTGSATGSSTVTLSMSKTNSKRLTNTTSASHTRLMPSVTSSDSMSLTHSESASVSKTTTRTALKSATASVQDSHSHSLSLSLSNSTSSSRTPSVSRSHTVPLSTSGSVSLSISTSYTNSTTLLPTLSTSHSLSVTTSVSLHLTRTIRSFTISSSQSVTHSRLDPTRVTVGPCRQLFEAPIPHPAHCPLQQIAARLGISQTSQQTSSSGCCIHPRFVTSVVVWERRFLAHTRVLLSPLPMTTTTRTSLHCSDPSPYTGNILLLSIVLILKSTRR